jgi:hypothetical protein
MKKQNQKKREREEPKTAVQKQPAPKKRKVADTEIDDLFESVRSPFLE